MVEFITNMGMAGIYILAWLLVWHFLLRGFAARHPDQAWAQGLANLA